MGFFCTRTKGMLSVSTPGKTQPVIIMEDDKLTGRLSESSPRVSAMAGDK